MSTPSAAEKPSTFKTTGTRCENCGHSLYEHKSMIYCPSRHSGQAVDKWFEAIVEASNGKHRVFYASDRPVIGSTCDGIAKPNKVIGYVCYKQGESPPDKDVLQFRVQLLECQKKLESYGS